MAMNEWEVIQHQQAATEMCYRLNVNPFEPIDSADPSGPQQWFRYAVRMAEHEVMVQTMRAFGRPV